MGVDGETAMHILEILGVFMCVHKLWPKGITYGEAEEWETKYRKKSGHSSKSKSSRARGGSSSYGSSSDVARRRERGDRYKDYEDPRHSRRASARY